MSTADCININNNKRRKSNESCVPKLLDDKRRKMERQLSASQRDELLFNEAKSDAQFKLDLANAILESNTY